MSDVILTNVADGVATITLNRPDARNALSIELLRALPKAVAEADADPEVSAIVLTGTDPAFSAGIDLREVASSDGGALRAGGPDARTTPRRGRCRPIPRLSSARSTVRP